MGIPGIDAGHATWPNTEHLSEEELEEFTDALGAYCRHESQADRDQSSNQAEALPALSEQERLELIARYMDQHPEQ